MHVLRAISNGWTIAFLWRNSLASAKLPHGTNGSNGLKRTLTTACSGRRRAPPLMLNVNATVLRTALWWCHLGAELPHLAESGHRAMNPTSHRCRLTRLEQN